MSEQQAGRYVLRISTLYASGLVVAIFVLLQAFLGLTSFDGWIEISVTASALALPLLAGILVVNVVEERYAYGGQGGLSKRLLRFCSRAGMGAALVSIDASFWHVLWLAGVGFLFAALVALCVCSVYVAQLEEDPVDAGFANDETISPTLAGDASSRRRSRNSMVTIDLWLVCFVVLAALVVGYIVGRALHH